MATLSSIILGISLNKIGIIRPSIYSEINTFLIPTSSLLLVITVGYKMRIKAVKSYIKESLVVSVIRFVIIPITISSIAYLVGLGEISAGLPLKVIIILSAMPPVFNSLIPPQIYGLDVDLANPSWLLTTGALVIVLTYYIFFMVLYARCFNR